MTTDFPDKRSALATGIYYAGFKTKEEIDAILEGLKSTETKMVGGIFGDVKTAEVYRFKNIDGNEACIGITEAGGEDVFHKGREGYHLWLIIEESGICQRV